jgi:F-type H+-transporting ATPase subunit a
VEHPYLYVVTLFEAIGLGDFAHSYTYVVYQWVVMLILIALSLVAAKGIQMVPGKAQNIFEVIISGLENFVVSITGDEGRWLFPLLATIFIFIAVSNLVGLVPGFLPPTANINTTGAFAIVVVVFTHVIGVRYHGAKYIKHFLGPVWWLAPLMFIIELIGHVARVLSLSIRLFGNMMAHEMVLAILFMLVGAWLLPIPIMVMGILVSFVQAFVFFLLSLMYFQAAMDHAH